MKTIFHKAYTRDVSVIMQEVWFHSQTAAFEEYSGKKNPHSPINLYFMNQGAIEVWENEQGLQWLKDKVLEKNIREPKSLILLIEKHKKQIEELQVFWDKGVLDSIQELEHFLELSFAAGDTFVPYYFSAIDERTPGDLRERAIDLRNKDLYFDSTDRVTRRSLLFLYPELKGCETVVFKSEIGKKIEVDLLKKRKANMVFIPGVYKECIALEEYKGLHKELTFEEEKILDTVEIKGQVAYKGIAIGRVKNIRRKEQISEVGEGEVLIAPMTTPDFLPAMIRAIAFVTDEGGITCHAAIVARELKKPCIVGTRFATQTLKDGDLVEVDADNGVIRIIR